MVCVLLFLSPGSWISTSNYQNKVIKRDLLGLISAGVFLSLLSGRWPVGWLHHHTRVGPWTPLSRDHAPSFTSNPDMEPIKVQSEGGLNVTLTIRLLMHGKVQKVLGNEFNFLFCNFLVLLPIICQKKIDNFKSPPWHKYTYHCFFVFLQEVGSIIGKVFITNTTSRACKAS